MIVKEYESARTFLEEYENKMQEREAVSQVLLSFAYQNLSSPETEKGRYGAVAADNEVQLLYCNNPEDILILYPVRHDKAAEAAAALADDLGSSLITISGISARLELCQSFIEQYKRYINCTFVQQLAVDIMEIRKVNDIKPAEGSQRQAHPEEAMLVTDWMLQFQIEAEIHELDYEAALQRAKRLISEGKVYLFEDEEHNAVSMAVAGGRLTHGMAITYVFTPEGYRGRGYAAANMYYLSKALLEEGYEYCTLSVDKRNPLSNRAYEKVGYQVVEENYEYRVLPAELNIL